MTESEQQSAGPWNERAARRPRLRLLGMTAALLLYPFIFVFPLYRALDATYRNAREPYHGYDSYSGSWKRAARVLRDETVYHCQVDRENPIPTTFARELVETLGYMNRVPVPLSTVHLGVSSWIRKRKWPLFRQGFEFDDICNYEEQEGGRISDRIHEHCRAQEVHFLRGDPVEPIAVYAEMSDLFQETARRFDVAIAEYERIRFLFGALMWGWAALELAGIVLLFGIARADLARWRAARHARDR